MHVMNTFSKTNKKNIILICLITYSVNRRTGVHVRADQMRFLHLTFPLLHNTLMHNCHLSINWLSLCTALCMQPAFLPKFSDETSFFILHVFFALSDFSASALDGCISMRERENCVRCREWWHLWDTESHKLLSKSKKYINDSKTATYEAQSWQFLYLMEYWSVYYKWFIHAHQQHLFSKCDEIPPPSSNLPIMRSQLSNNDLSLPNGQNVQDFQFISHYRHVYDNRVK